jgi:subtilisin family serine protease
MAYSNETGYGLINAAAAVAATIGQDPFADVEDGIDPDGTANGWDWGIDRVKAPEAWRQGYTGQGITVAVLDTGIDRNHPDLVDNIWTNAGEIPDNGLDDDDNGYIDDIWGWNIANDTNDTSDANGHGTHVAGTIAAADNDFGTTGVAPNAKIMPVQVVYDEGDGDAISIADGIYYAADNGAKIINISITIPNSAGSPNYDAELQEAIAYASEKGSIVVMAAGNDGSNSPDYPAAFANEWGLAVGAIDINGNIADFSNRAGNQAINYVTAPGADIVSTVPNESDDDGYRTENGTSMAAPHVAGLVALMLSANPNLTEADVRNTIASTSSASLTPTPEPTEPEPTPTEPVPTQPTPTEPVPTQPTPERLDTSIYRFQNTSEAGTYVYVGEEERQSILQNNPNFVEEGFAFNVGIAPEDNLFPLYRFQNTSQPGTYLFVGEEERQNILANNPNFDEEGLAFYAYGAEAALGTPLYRFQNTSQPGTYLFVGEEERQNILANNPSFVEEGSAFEIGV